MKCVIVWLVGLPYLISWKPLSNTIGMPLVKNDLKNIKQILPLSAPKSRRTKEFWLRKKHRVTISDVLKERLLGMHMGMARDVAGTLGVQVSNHDSRVQVISKIVNALLSFEDYKVVSNAEAGGTRQIKR